MVILVGLLLTSAQTQSSRSNGKDIFAKTIWAEARGEPVRGQKMVANVIKERAAQNKSNFGGSSIEGVCKKDKQFSCWNGKTDIDVSRDVTSYNQIRQWSDSMYDAPNIANRNTPDHYYNPSIVNPSWAKKCRETETIGNHKFVRCNK